MKLKWNYIWPIPEKRSENQQIISKGDIQLLIKFTYIMYIIYGSFRVRSTNFLLNLRVTPPISMKFGTLADNA